MGNNQEYEEFLATEDNGSLSFKKVSDLFKRSALRILIYVLIAVIVSTSLLLMVMAFKTDKQYQSKITFNNKHIEEGMSPWNATMDITNTLRSSSAVSEAMRKSGFSEEVITENLGKVLAGLAVESIAAPIEKKDEKPTTEVYAYAYRITLPHIDGVKWTKESYTMLLDNIVDTFVATFKSTYSIKSYSDSLANFDVSKYNYFQSYDSLRASLVKMETIVSSMSDMAEGYRASSTGKTFNDIKAEALALESSLMTFNSFMVSSGVSSGSASGSEIDFITQKITDLKAQSTPLRASLTSLEQVIKDTKQTIVVNANGTITLDNANTDIQKSLVNNYNKTLTQLQMVDAELAKWDGGTGMLTQYKTANTTFEGKSAADKAALRAQAIATIENIKTNFGSITVELNNTIADYNKESHLKDFVKKTAPATETTTKAVSTMVFVVVELVVAIAAMAGALFVTNRRGKMNFKKAQEEKEKVEEIAE